MKHILTLLVILIIPYISYGQTFNELLSETLDSTYKDITKTSHIHIKGYIKNSMPYKFKASDQIETLKNQNQQRNKYYLRSYGVVLGKDSLFLLTNKSMFDKTKENYYKHNFSKIKWGYYPFYTTYFKFYIKIKDKWIAYKPTDDLFAQWYTEARNKKRQRILDLINEALIGSLNNMQMTKNILIIENTLGATFFLWEYNKEHFPYMVASQEDLTKKVLKKYKTLIGWCSIDLDGNTLSIKMRVVDSKKYRLLPDKENVDNAIIATQTYHFRYCDEHKKWCMVK